MESHEDGDPVTAVRRDHVEAGDPVCWSSRVCPECGSFAEGPVRAVCPGCGAAMPVGEDGVEGA